MHPFIMITSVFTNRDPNRQTALELLKSYFTYCTDLRQFPVTERNVVLGLILKGFPPKNEIAGWWNEVHAILEQTCQRLLNNNEELAFSYNTRKSFYMTLSEPLRTQTLDQEPFERIFVEIAKIVEDMEKTDLVSNPSLN